MKEGDTVFLTDGKGTLAEAILLQFAGKRCHARIMNSRQTPLESGISLHIAIAPTKSTDRFTWFCEKATELGIAEITPLICARSERSSIKTDRFHKVLIAAMKQSLKTWLPILHEPVPFDRFLKNTIPGQKFLAWCGTGEEPGLWRIINAREPVTVMIGPEGDFTDAEVGNATSHGFIPVSLGKSRLRTETSGLLVCCLGRIMGAGE